MTTSSESTPIWLDGNGKIDEVGFCESFRESHPMLCIHETFFTRDGKVTDESRLKSEVCIFVHSENHQWNEVYVDGTRNVGSVLCFIL